MPLWEEKENMLFIGALKKEKKKEKEKDSQYKIKRPMAIALA